MGIVVTVAMLLGLILLLKNNYQQSLTILMARLIFIIGLWNMFGYGIWHLQTFWGLVALTSGFVIALSAILIMKQANDALLSANVLFNKVYTVIKPFSIVIIVALAAGFALYAVTLVRLNLGMSII